MPTTSIKPIQIAVSGNICSGKSTLAKRLSRGMRLQYIPTSRIEEKFFRKFFDNPGQWFLETQLSFLLSKAIEVEKSMLDGVGTIMDRSVFEDKNIFAKYWIEHAGLDQEKAEIYNTTAKYIISTMPKLDLLIYCNASSSVCAKRFADRDKRTFELNYPEGYINDIGQMYKCWADNFNGISSVTIDTEKYDIRQKRVMDGLLDDLIMLFNGSQCIEKNLPLFGEKLSQKIDNVTFNVLETLGGVPKLRQLWHVAETIKNKKPVIYIAAPFTSFATDATSEKGLFEIELYGAISEEYKRSLLNIERKLKKIGFETMLPHRDINRWGKKQIGPEEVLSLLFQSVEESDVFFAIPSLSMGVHLELGAAVAQGKRIILVTVEEMGESFFDRGFLKNPQVMYYRVRTLKEVPDILDGKTVWNFVNQPVTGNRI